MKAKHKNLVVLFYLANQPRPAGFKPKERFQYAHFSKTVVGLLEILNKAEVEHALSLDPEFEKNGNRFKGENSVSNANRFEKEIKGLREEEIELPEIQSFKLSEWPDLQLTDIQLSELLELGIIKEE